MNANTDGAGQSSEKGSLAELVELARALARGERGVSAVLRRAAFSGELAELAEALAEIGDSIQADRTTETAQADRFRSALLELVTETTLDGILVVDDAGKTLTANERFAELWRIPAEIVASGDDNEMLEFVLDQLAEPERFLEKVRDLYNKPDERSRDLLVFKDGRLFDRFSAPLVDRLGKHIGRVWTFRDVTDMKQLKQFQDERAALQQEVIDAQRRALSELSTPLLPIASDAVAMPLIGEVDAWRGALIVETLINGVSAHQARIALVDLTGMTTVDTLVAEALVKATQACRLLGAEVVLTGIRPNMAQVLSKLGIQFTGARTLGTLQAGIEYVYRRPSSA